MNSYTRQFTYNSVTVTLDAILATGAINTPEGTITTHSIRAQYSGNDEYLGGYRREELVPALVQLENEIKARIDGINDAELVQQLIDAGYTAQAGGVVAPDNFVSTAQTNSTITMDWDAVTGADGYVFGFASQSDFSDVANYDFPTDAPITVTGLAANTLYYFRVQAFEDGVGYSPYNYATATTNP